MFNELIAKAKERLKIVECPIPELDATLYLRELTAGDGLAFKTASVDEETLIKTSLQKMVCTKDGDPVFEDLAQVQAFLNVVTPPVMKRIEEAAAAFNADNRDGGKEQAQGETS